MEDCFHCFTDSDLRAGNDGSLGNRIEGEAVSTPQYLKRGEGSQHRRPAGQFFLCLEQPAFCRVQQPLGPVIYFLSAIVDLLHGLGKEPMHSQPFQAVPFPLQVNNGKLHELLEGAIQSFTPFS